VSWRGHLALRYWRDGERTVAHDRHEGPLRVLQRLYPEGPGICHHVLVHPPGGIVGGDQLVVEAGLEAGTHAVITTPGATRFYRTAGAAAMQDVRLRLAGGARLEWLPLETIAYRGCLGENRLRIELDDGAETIGWDVLALGLPAAEAAFDAGAFTQHLELPGRWLERGCVAAGDLRLLDAPLGWAGQRVLATAWFAAGTPLTAARREQLLESARACVAASPLAARAGATSTHEGVVVLRVLAARVEPALALLNCVRAAWREAAWALPAAPPRVWRT
jgi:urease accessory protein